jgi:hypothetical protein
MQWMRWMMTMPLRGLDCTKVTYYVFFFSLPPPPPPNLGNCVVSKVFNRECFNHPQPPTTNQGNGELLPPRLEPQKKSAQSVEKLGAAGAGGNSGKRDREAFKQIEKLLFRFPSTFTGKNCLATGM